MKDIKMQTLQIYPFLGSIIAGIQLIPSNDIERAGTTGKVVYYNPEFINTLNKSEQIYVFAHEFLHIAFDHLTRAKGKDFELWNIATDAVINGLLEKDGFSKPSFSIIFQNGACDKTAEQVYAELLKEQRINGDKDKSNIFKKPSKEDGMGSESNKKCFQGHASHEMWTEAYKNEQEITDAKAVSYAVQKSILAGKSSSAVAKAFKLEFDTAPLINWKYLLRQSLKQNEDWSYKYAEFKNGVLLPKLMRLPANETQIMIDTSGSVSNKLIMAFLMEIKNILKTSKVLAGCFDTQFYGFQEVTKKNINCFNIVGRGGTNFNIAVNSFTKGAINKIIFTDGYAKMPEISVNAIWVVIGENNIQPKGGKVIHINEEQLRKVRLKEFDTPKEY